MSNSDFYECIKIFNFTSKLTNVQNFKYFNIF